MLLPLLMNLDMYRMVEFRPGGGGGGTGFGTAGAKRWFDTYWQDVESENKKQLLRKIMVIVSE